MKIVILAGGEGSRLWPLSHPLCPKPFLRFFGQESLLQNTLRRFTSLCSFDSMIVVTQQSCEELARQQCREIDAKEEITILGEPIGRSTAPAFTMALCYLQEEGKVLQGEKVLLVPSDGLFSPESALIESVHRAAQKMHWEDIVVFGVAPLRAERSYGYILPGREEDGLFLESHFIEKPSQEQANCLVEEDRVLWNTGHLLITIEGFWREIARHAPDIAALQNCSYQEMLEKFPHLPSISMDHALLENSAHLVAVAVDAAWSDVGTWDRIYEVLKKNDNHTVWMACGQDIGSKGCFFLSEDIDIVTVGLDNVVVVATPRGVMVAHKDRLKEMQQCITQALTHA